MSTRRSFLAALVAVASLAPLAAYSADFPKQQVRVVVSNAPGTGTDTTARFIANDLSKQWGVPVVVENRPGAGGAIATEFVNKQPADGYTILFNTGAHYSYPATLTQPPFDASKDLTLVSSFVQAPIAMFVAADSPFKTVQDVLDAAKKKPQSVSFSTPGTGTSSHLAAVLLLSQTGVDMLHVPYKSASQAALEVASGQAQVGFNGTSSTLPLVQSGRIRILAVTGAQRSASLPDVPTMAEAGVKGYEFVTPILALVPAGTPEPVVQTIASAIEKAARTPEFKNLVQGMGMDPIVRGPEQLKASAQADFDQAKRLAELAGVAANR